MNQPVKIELPEEVIEAERLILEKYPTATFYQVSSSDQGHHGFVLCGVGVDDTIADDDTDDTFTDWCDAVNDELGNVSWGVFGDRNADTEFDVDLSTHRIIRTVTA